VIDGSGGKQGRRTNADSFPELPDRISFSLPVRVNSKGNNHNMQMRDKDTAYFFELETSLHKKEIRSRADLTSELLADTFIEFGSSGKVWNKSSIVASMRGEESDSQITVEDFAVRELAPEVVLVTYTSKKVAEDQAVASTLRSSIWKHVDGKWQMIFHQGTRTCASDVRLSANRK
jgi:hypothetical protein